jgi:hypothetical protein
MMPSVTSGIIIFVSGNPFELRKPVGRISKLLSAVRHFVTLAQNSDSTPL